MAGLGRPWRIGQSAWLLGLLFAAIAAPASAQFRPPLRTGIEVSPEQSLLSRLPKEPQFSLSVGNARELIEAKDYDAAIDTLQPLLEKNEDFFESENEKLAGSALDRVEKLLHEMPAEGVDSYRRRYEPLAAQRLTGARARHDLAELLAIVRTYPLTLAAAEATQVAGEIAFDQGETALAARLWERLLPTTAVGVERTDRLIRIAQAWTLAGQPAAAAEQVRELSTLAQTSPIEYQGKLLTPPATADVGWLNKVFGPVPPLVPQRVADWRMTGGHPRRWSNGWPVSPIQRGSWAYPLVDQYDIYVSGRDAIFQTALRDLNTKFQKGDSTDSSKTSPVVIGAPLVVGETVLVQGLGSVKALDARTGQIRWSGVVEDDTFLYWAWRNYEEKGANPRHDSLLETYLGQRAWLNQAGAALASDGQQVYAISGTGMSGIFRAPMMFARGMQQPPPLELIPPNNNRLLAYDIQTGLLKWECGGPAVAAQLDERGQSTNESRRLSGAFILGAPLPVDGQLFVLAEDRGQIRLFSLSPETGEAEWSLPLLNPANGIVTDEVRRMYGLSPAYGGGLLICPTGEGVVVAVDPLRRRVRWVQQYQERPATLDPRAFAMLQMQRQPRMGNNESPLVPMLSQRRWLDSAPLLTAGRILLPAAETGQLHCLDMESGASQWTLPRGEGLFVAACTDRYCLIAGERSLQRVQLSDGKVRWTQEIPTPSGRGVVSGKQYLLPVATNEILAIEMETGHILARSTLDAKYRAGSLIAAGGQLVMQTASEVVGLRSLSQVSSELALDLKTPEARARALSEQGELLLFQGQEAEAIALLQESLQLQDSLPTRKLLVWSLLERLKADYAGSRGLVPELQRMVTDPEQKKLLTRLHAEGLERVGELVAAYRAYLELLPEIARGSPQSGESLTETSPNLQIRTDRWLRGRLTHLRTLADEPSRTQMDAALQEVIAAQEPHVKPQLASVLGIDLAPQLHLDLALANRLDYFLGQRVLWTLSESNDPRWRGPAVTRLFRSEVSQKRLTYLPPLISLLQHELAAVECVPGFKGLDLLEEYRRMYSEDKAVAPLFAPSSVELPEFVAGSAGIRVHDRTLYPVLGARRGPYSDWLFALEMNPTRLTQCCDGTGRMQHPFNHESLGDGNAGPVRYVQTDPQLVLLAFRSSFAVIHPLEAGKNQFQMKFQADLKPNSNMGFRNRNPLMPTKPGVRDRLYPAGDGSGPYIGNLGPLTFDTLCFQSEGNLFAVRPYGNDGKTQWKRTGVASGSEICADSEYVVLIPPQGDRLIVLQAADGTQVAERPLPKDRVARQRADWGRLFLVRRVSPGEAATPESVTWAMYDPATDRDAWSLSLPSGTLWTPVEGADLAFLEPNGTLHIVDDQTGQVRWKTALPAQPFAPTEFTVHADAHRFYVHTAHQRNADQAEMTGSLSAPEGNEVRVNGIVAALDRWSGQVLWSRPLEQQVFHPNLPVESGVLVYAAERKRLTPEKKEEIYTSMVFLDRRTGEPAFSKEITGLTARNESWAASAQGLNWLRVRGQDIQLKRKTDTGEEPDTEAPEQDEPLPDALPEVPLPGALRKP